jgi:hypothetical protein
MEQTGQRRPVLVDESPLHADGVMPVLGEGLRHLYRQAVEVEILLVAVGSEQIGRSF